MSSRTLFLRALVIAEWQRREQEGVQTGWDRSKIEALTLDQLQAAFEELRALPSPPEIVSSEPLNWAVPSLNLSAWHPSESELRKKIAGAWFGRIAGCILGKPLEIGIVFSEWAPLREYLTKTGQWPLRDYVVSDETAAIASFGHGLGCPASWKQNLAFAESDDDLRYTFAGIEILEKFGADFTTNHVASWWTTNLVPAQLFTAEQIVVMNLYAAGIPHGGAVLGVDQNDLDWIRNNLNPYLEFIGAAIRADGWAYGFAGNPYQAALAAQKDARLSHSRSGEYSEIFFATVISAAFCHSVSESLQIGLEAVPPESRFAKSVRETIYRAAQVSSDDEMLEWLHAEFNELDGVHAINNACLCVAALSRHPQEFSAAIGMAVMGGWDPDCNGATVGSVLGANLGFDGIPKHWIEPLHDTIDLDLRGRSRFRISELVDRTVSLWQRLNRVR